MKKLLMATIVLAGTYAMADAPAPAPSVVGKWDLTSRACSSNAQINDGVKIGTDTIVVSNNADNTFSYDMTVGGCLTSVKGTYKVDGMKVDYTSVTSQSCKDANPTPMVMTESMFVAYLSDTEAVTISTGDKAAKSCPAGDALIMHFNKEAATP